MEFGKRLETVGDIEMAVRYRILPRCSSKLDRAARKRGDHFRDFTERSGSPRRNIERAGASVLQHRADQRRHVVDMDVIALLLALPEQRDRLALGGKPSEAIRAVAVMGVFRS